MRIDLELRENEEFTSEPVLEPVEPKGIERPPPSASSDLAVFMRRARAAAPVALVGLFLLVLTAFLHFARPFAMPIVLAMFLAFLLKPIVRTLNDLRIPEALGAGMVIAVFFLVVSLAISQLAQPAALWLAKAPEMVEQGRAKFQTVFLRAERLSRAAAQVESMTANTTGEKTPQVEVKQPVLFNTVVTYTKSFIFGSIETVVLLFFMLATGDMFLQKLVKVLPTLHDKKRAVGIAHQVQHSISTFLFTITAINAVLGLLVGLAAYFVGLPNPVLWGVLAGALNFIPYFGPITGVAVLLIAGFVTFDSPVRVVAPALFYLGLHGVESNLITPMILGRRLTLNPLVIFISLIFWTWLWGIPGALLSIPMLMMLKILCDHFESLAPVSEFLSGSNQGPLTSNQ